MWELFTQAGPVGEWLHAPGCALAVAPCCCTLLPPCARTRSEHAGAAAAVNVYLPKDRVTNTHQGYGFVEFKGEDDADYVSGQGRGRQHCALGRGLTGAHDGTRERLGPVCAPGSCP
jgi:hypothetical protein